MRDVVVTGAGGFVGFHLVRFLKSCGHCVRGVDIKEPEFAPTDADEFFVLDLRRWENCTKVTQGAEHVYALAADMGGMGFISDNHSEILRNNALINIHTLDAARENGVDRYFFSSSACVYPDYKQADTDVPPLVEDDVIPAAPQDAYGWEKLVAELLCQYYAGDHGIETRIARFHNVYGPLGTWRGGREKAPAALCRKVAEVPDGGEIEVWGDGKQTRSFCYVDDCVEGIYRLMCSDYSRPLNLGSDVLVTIDELAHIVMDIAEKNLSIRHVEGPQGVRGRNSDNTRCKEVLGWSPSTDLSTGLRPTYEWIASQVSAAGG